MRAEACPRRRAPTHPLCRPFVGAVLLTIAASPATEAQTRPDPASPELRPGLFERLFDRRDYLRQSAPLRRRVEQAERAARDARDVAEEAAREGTLPPPPPRVLAPLPDERLEDPRAEERRAVDAAERTRQRLMQDRLQRFLRNAGRADRASLDADAAAARAAQTGTVARGVDRLQSGAAAGRNALGDRPRLGGGPLIRTPRVEME